MKVSTLISKLQLAMAKYGDLEVKTLNEQLDILDVSSIWLDTKPDFRLPEKDQKPIIKMSFES